VSGRRERGSLRRSISQLTLVVLAVEVTTVVLVATVHLAVSLAIVTVLLVGAGAWAWRLFRREVESPLLALGEDADVISRGYLEHPVAEVGPTEVADLARSMEAMRARILEEVARVEAARALLQEQAEELTRSNAELEQFAYVASHDLQEPLRKISSFCQLLEQRYGGQLDERADQYIHFAVDGAKRMQTLINDLLAFSRVGRLGGALEPTSLGDALHRAMDNLSTAIEESGAIIEASSLPDVLGDANLLAALFQNLLGNAMKFRRPDAMPSVRIAAVEQGDEVEVAVIDNGIGIDEEYAERIFIIFQRLHGRDAYEGTGIGLALCRKIVEHHGGRIWVDTSVTEGASIHFTLPLVPEPTAEGNPP
jgi:light-regulated signal transduction histidine kinase (bacteriophytochrome)